MDTRVQAPLEDLVVHRDPPPNRVGRTTGGAEQHLTEAAVMLAFAMHLLNEQAGTSLVEIHPDGEHVKRFELEPWLLAHGFSVASRKGKGAHFQRGDHAIAMSFTAGLGDVVGTNGNRRIVAECKGGILNTTHPGQKSRLRRGLCEAVGQMMGREQKDERHIAVVPDTQVTRNLADRMRHRCRASGIEIALVAGDGCVSFIA
ncbi:hypothetical protein [Desertibaculum subflavum]|uniref:hypothetical protein n=1 Tax=Desertibaculum subflavum TaxID=2268458 RepID=UPI000E66A2FC